MTVTINSTLPAPAKPLPSGCASADRSANKMLLDINSPKSRAIFAAARELDALHVIWQSQECLSQEEATRRIEALRVLAAEHFPEAPKIGDWLTQFAELFALPCASREVAKQIYDNLCVKLDSAEGFETVFI